MLGNSEGSEAVESQPLPIGQLSRLFRFQKWKPGRGEAAPRLNEDRPLTLFYHAGNPLDGSST